MRIAVIAAIFPPNILGGAEVSALNLSLGLKARGHMIQVLSTKQSEEIARDESGGLEVERISMPRAYTLLNAAEQPSWRKTIWHAQDIFDPRNRTIWARFLDTYRPDFALIHICQGIGYNGLVELAKRDIPAIAVLHDLAYVCYKMTMFKKGGICEKPCTLCHLSSIAKAKYLANIPRLGIVSPSNANLLRVQANIPIADRPMRVILNANTYPQPDRAPRGDKDRLRFLYVGQIVLAKGVEFLLALAEQMAKTLPLEVVIVGDGIELPELRNQFGHYAWVTFTGKVSAQEVANRMGDSDVLCVPSIWADNSPGVIIHALQLGLPVFGSDVGGIGELVEDRVNGRLLPASDAAAWRSAMAEAIECPGAIKTLSNVAREGAARFSPKRSVDAYEDFILEIAALPRRSGAAQKS